MGGAAVVTGLETLNSEHALTSRCQMMKRRASHRTEAADDGIEIGRSGGPLPFARHHHAYQDWPAGRHMVAILRDIAAVRFLSALIFLAILCDIAVAQTVPLPRPRPAQAPAAQPADAADVEEPPPPSACRLRLTSDLAVAPSVPPLTGPGECGIDAAVRLEAVVLPDRSRVALSPPATVHCTFAEAIVQWVRQDLAPAVRSLGASLRSIDNYSAYDCRGRNRVVGARLSEHGKGNALDIRLFKLADGKVVRLTDPEADKDFREALRKITCARFTTVLGPGSDGYHEDHVHVDRAERHGGRRMCQWEVREPPAPELTASVDVPLPRPRPAAAP